MKKKTRLNHVKDNLRCRLAPPVMQIVHPSGGIWALSLTQNTYLDIPQPFLHLEGEAQPDGPHNVRGAAFLALFDVALVSRRIPRGTTVEQKTTLYCRAFVSELLYSGPFQGPSMRRKTQKKLARRL